jgi:hypothetical protein
MLPPILKLEYLRARSSQRVQVSYWSPVPFSGLTVFPGLSEAQVRQQLNEEDRVNAVHGNAPPHATTKSEFIALGLELEDEQYVFANLGHLS